MSSLCRNSVIAVRVSNGRSINTKTILVVNNGNANSADIEKLINKVKKTVSDKVGVNLELEIKIVGE